MGFEILHKEAPPLLNHQSSLIKAFEAFYFVKFHLTLSLRFLYRYLAQTIIFQFGYSKP